MQALLIQSVDVGDLVPVIVAVADEHTLAVQHFDVAVHIADTELDLSPVGLNDPTELAELEYGVHHTGDPGDHVEFLKAILHRLT